MAKSKSTFEKNQREKSKREKRKNKIDKKNNKEKEEQIDFSKMTPEEFIRLHDESNENDS